MKMLRNEADTRGVETTCCHQMEVCSLNADSAETQRTREKSPIARATQSIAVVCDEQVYLQLRKHEPDSHVTTTGCARLCYGTATRLHVPLSTIATPSLR